jgi:TPR repeat protein
MTAMRATVFPTLFLTMALALALVLVGGLAGVRPAAAQFYDLDGAYHCLTQPNAACQERQREQPVPPPSPDPSTVLPTLDDAIAHVRAKTATGRDLAVLESHAAAKEPRAIEVLAWCKLSGIGGSPDMVAAYRLYGEAADLGVANARKNQIAIYETRLTPEQRQSVLLPQTGR